jgi:hypothetical protein
MGRATVPDANRPSHAVNEATRAFGDLGLAQLGGSGDHREEQVEVPAVELLVGIPGVGRQLADDGGHHAHDQDRDAVSVGELVCAGGDGVAAANPRS